MIQPQYIFNEMEKRKIKEVIFVPGKEPIFKTEEGIESAGGDRVMPDDTRQLLISLRQRTTMVNAPLQSEGHFSFGLPGLGRFHVNYFMQRGSYAVVIRKISPTPPSFEELIPDGEAIERLKRLIRHKGLFLVISSYTYINLDIIASIISYLIQNENKIIYTIELPLTYAFKHENSIIMQREVGQDVLSLEEALISALRISPDFAYVSELQTSRDLELFLKLVEHGNTVFLPYHAADIHAALTGLERLATDHKGFRETISHFLVAIISPKLEQGDIKAVNIIVKDAETEAAIKEGRYDEILVP